MKVQPLIAVADVQRSSRWYQKILKCKSGHSGGEYEQLIKEDDEDFFLQLHAWSAYDHPNEWPRPKTRWNARGLRLLGLKRWTARKVVGGWLHESCFRSI